MDRWQIGEDIDIQHLSIQRYYNSNPRGYDERCFCDVSAASIDCESATDGKKLTKLIKVLTNQALNVSSECKLAVIEDAYACSWDGYWEINTFEMNGLKEFSSYWCLPIRMKFILSVFSYNRFEMIKQLISPIHKSMAETPA